MRAATVDAWLSLSESATSCAESYRQLYNAKSQHACNLWDFCESQGMSMRLMQRLCCSAGTAQAMFPQHPLSKKGYEGSHTAETHHKTVLAPILHNQSSPDDSDCSEAASAAGSQCGSTMSGLEGLVHWEAISSLSSAASSLMSTDDAMRQ